MEVDGDVEPFAAQPLREREIVEQPPGTAALGRDDQLVEMRVAAKDRSR